MCYNKIVMRRFILSILALFLLFTTVVNAKNLTTKKDISVTSADGFSIKATFEYPKVKNKKEYSTVVLLHSLGYSSEWWENLPQELIDQGYAVLKIDLRGHGKSVFNSKLVRLSWKNMTNSSYAKYPDDVIRVIESIKKENTKKTFFNNWAIVGSDIGGNTAILASEKLKNKPKTIVLLSPTIDIRGLYTPVKLANLTDTDIFSISGTGDVAGEKAQEYLRKFAQAEFATYTSESRSTGMLMLKNDKSLAKIITTWISEYLPK